MTEQDFVELIQEYETVISGQREPDTEDEYALIVAYNQGLQQLGLFDLLLKYSTVLTTEVLFAIIVGYGVGQNTADELDRKQQYN